jgi:2-octaprenyl-6-methoxyphenol hydroxylase
MTDRFDAIIVGGGMVGATLALALGAHGLTSAVIDRADLGQTTTTAFDGRVSAIASASANMLRAIGLADLMDAHGQPIVAIRTTDGLSPLHLHFDSAQAGTGPLGWMVENRTIRARLLDALAAQPHATLIAPAAVATIERDGPLATVTLADGRTLAAPLLVAADGRGSALRREAGIRVAEWSYAATALVTSIRHALPHDGIAFELFFPGGPFAILPMLDDEAGHHRSAIVWTVKAREAEGWATLSPRAFARELETRMDGFLGEVALLTPVTRWPLSFHHAQAFTARRLALVGDAGHGIHPIAGQGLNLGLRDVAALTQALVEGARLGLDPGDSAVLERYARWRALDVTAISAATDLLSRLFNVPGRAPALVRRLGLAAVNRVPRLKAAFMAEARGEGGDLPALLRGELA